MTSSIIAITRVRVFDGATLSEERTVAIENGLISSTASTTNRIDGHGGVLLPGLIDSHVHIMGVDELEKAAQWGITTMLDMGSFPPERIAGLRGRPALSDIRSSGSPASAPGGIQTTLMKFPPETAVTGPDDAERFVSERAAEGSDYLKIIVEDEAIMGPAALNRATIAALVDSAHRRNLRVFAHVTTVPAMQMAIDAGVDVLTHAPIDAPLGGAQVGAIAAAGMISVPTLVMMKGVASQRGLPTHRGGISFRNAESTVAALHRAGVPIVAGTDSNSAPGSILNVRHGESLHEELALLVAAGLPPVEALRSATNLPARLFDLGDRGAIEPGRRADLLLVDGDPTVDIAATRAIQHVWIGGTQVR